MGWRRPFHGQIDEQFQASSQMEGFSCWVTLSIATVWRRFKIYRWFFFDRSEVDSIYIDVYRGGSLKKSSVYPFLKEQPAASVDSVLNEMVGHLTNRIWHAYDESGEKMMGNDLLFFVRLACSMSPKNSSKVMWYAELCVDLGIQLDDAIELLQVWLPSIKRMNTFNFCVNICTIIFSLKNSHLKSILFLFEVHRISWSNASVSSTNKKLKSLQRWGY